MLDLRLRLASTADAERLFIWRNDPATRAQSRNTEPVAWNDHIAWLTRRLERDDPALYIAEVEGTPVATLRLDGDEVSYTVSPERRGQGVASALLELARTRFGVLRAGIKPENEASIRAAEKAGHTVVLLPASTP